MKISNHIKQALLVFLLLAWAAHSRAQAITDTKLSTVEIVKEFLDAAQHMNHAKAAALLDPNVVWEQPGDNRVSGTKRSADSLFGMIGEMLKLSDHTIKLTEIKAITVNANRVACLVHWTAQQPAGGILDVDNIDVYTVENGKIVKVTIFSADLEQENKFWGR